MPEDIRFVDKPDRGFPAPPGMEITRSVPVGVAGVSIQDASRPSGEALQALRHGMRVKQVLAREQKPLDPGVSGEKLLSDAAERMDANRPAIEDDNNMDSGK